METAQSQALDQLHDEYMAARTAYKEAERKFNALVAGIKDLPPALNTRSDYIEVAGPGMLAIEPPPSGPPWAQPPTPPAKRIVTRKEFARIDEYIAALGDLKRKLQRAQ